MVEILDEITTKKYPAYKDSGMEWLGDVPEHWDLTRIGNHFEERRVKVSDKNFAPLSVTKEGVLPQLASAAKTDDGDNRKLVKSGDFVINSRSDRKGSSGIANTDGSVSLINIVMQPLGVHPLFCNYLLRSYSFVEEFYRMGHGIVSDLWTTRYDEMKAIVIALPNYEEQDAIARFLDKKIALIDKGISTKEKQIELLKERQQILIHRAVTRGLNPNVKMKDSGVEGGEEIPEGWNFSKLKHFLDILPGFAFPSQCFIKEGGIRLLRGVNISIGCTRWEDVVYWPKNMVKKLNLFYLEEGDIVIGMDRPMISNGMRVARIREEDLPCLLLQRVARIRAKDGLDKDFLFLILNSKTFTDYFYPILSGVSVPHISPDQIQSFKIGIPSIETQRAIVSFIEKQSDSFLKIISNIKQEISKLKEYKSTLINSAVTGKIKVC